MTFVSRRSPWMVPRPAGAEQARRPEDPVQRLLLAAAWRPRAFAVSLAAALGRIPGGALPALHERIGGLLQASAGFAELLRASGLDDAETQVQARLADEPLPTCASWAEVAIAEATFGRALAQAFDALRGSEHETVAAAAARAGAPCAGAAEALDELARDAKNRECLQILVDRWMPAAVRVLGRPGRPAEPALHEARIAVDAPETALAAFLSGVEGRLHAAGLWLPDAARMGVEVPAGWTPARSR